MEMYSAIAGCVAQLAEAVHDCHHTASYCGEMLVKACMAQYVLKSELFRQNLEMFTEVASPGPIQST